MEPTYFAQYRGYEFQCSPERLGGNTFAPRLVIYNASESTTMELSLDMPAVPFEDPTAAAHQAFAHGRRWVDGGGTIVKLATPVDASSPDPEQPLLPR